MPLATICGNSGPTGSPSARGTPLSQRKPDIETPQFSAFSRASWSRCREVGVLQAPAQVLDAELGVASPRRSRTTCSSGAGWSGCRPGVLVAPARLGAPGAAPRARRRSRSGSAGAANGAAHSPIAPVRSHVVAEELELVLQPLAQLGQLVLQPAERSADEALVVQEVHLQPDERLALAVQREPRVVHPVVVEVEQSRGSAAGRAAPGRACPVGDRDQRLVEDGRQADAAPCTPSRRARCASCPRRSGGRAGGRARGWPVRAAAGDRAVGADRTGPASGGRRVSKNALPRLLTRAGPLPPW